jgi:hypothetical protein
VPITYGTTTPGATMPGAATPDTKAASPHLLLPPGSHPAPLAHLQALAETITTVGVPGALLGTAPADAFLPLDDLQALINLKTLPLEIRDDAWRHIVTNTRAHGGPWHLLALGAAMRQLRYVALIMAPRDTSPPDHVFAVHAHLAAEFLLGVQRVRLHKANIGRRLVNLAREWAVVGLRGHSRKQSRREVHYEWAELFYPDVLADTRPDPQRADAVYEVLNRLVARSVDRHPSRTDRRPKLTYQDAVLIARCKLGGESITYAARALGITAASARNRLSRVRDVVPALLAEEADEHRQLIEAADNYTPPPPEPDEPPARRRVVRPQQR